MTARRRARAPSPADERFMREALALAARARGRTAPNPMVGAIVVRSGQRVAAGYHARDGEAHAEAVALRKAGARARGATLYVTLEPCAHTGRQPPCVDAVLASGVRRVVVAAVDPDPRTCGKSLRKLRRAGVEVVTGVGEAEAVALNRGFESRLRRARPFTIVKLASTLDGRVATRTGESRWITEPAARAWVHDLRARVDAIAVGSETARIDDPALTARRGGRVVHRPRRIVVDSLARTPPNGRLLRASGETIVLASDRAPASRRRALEAAGARVELCPRARRSAKLDLLKTWRILAGLGVNELLVEGGGGLASALLARGLVDELHLFLAPMLIGSDGRPSLGPLGVERIADALRPRVTCARQIGRDWLFTAEW